MCVGVGKMDAHKFDAHIKAHITYYIICNTYTAPKPQTRMQAVHFDKPIVVGAPPKLTLILLLLLLDVGLLSVVVITALLLLLLGKLVRSRCTAAADARRLLLLHGVAASGLPMVATAAAALLAGCPG